MTTYDVERILESQQDERSDIGSDQAVRTEPVTVPGSAAFQAKYVGRDFTAGIITGAMAIPLSVGIAMMSDYPIKVGLATVAFACLIGRINA
jgi:MFS superfamily sulfate permease-like transporter